MPLKPHYRLLLVLTIFLIPMLACNSLLGGQSAEQESVAVIEQEDTAQETTAAENTTQENTAENAEQSPAVAQQATNNDAEATQGETGSGDDQQVTATSVQPSLPIALNDLPFQSYRFLMGFAATTNGNDASMQITLIRNIATGDTLMQMEANGVPDMEEFAGGSMSFVIKDNNAYLPLGSECMVVPANIGNPMDEMLSADNLFFGNDDVQVTYVSDETVNGLAVKSYQITGISDDTLEEASGRLYVHTLPDGRDIVVKAQMTGRSTTNPITEAPGQTEIAFDVELTDINGAPNVEIPANCQNATSLSIPDLTTAGNAAVNAAGDAVDAAGEAVDIAADALDAATNADADASG